MPLQYWVKKGFSPEVRGFFSFGKLGLGLELTFVQQLAGRRNKLKLANKDMHNLMICMGRGWVLKQMLAWRESWLI